MKDCKISKILGLAAICIHVLLVLKPLYLLYAYNFTSTLFLLMYPNWVLLVNALLGIIGIITSILLYKGKIGIKLFVIVTLILWLVTFSNYFFQCIDKTQQGYFFILSPVEPQKGVEYDKTNNYFSLLDVWWDQHTNFVDKFNGTFPQSGQWEQGFNRQTREFTVNFTKGYMIILVTTWNGTIGNVTFDNIKIEEL